MKLRLCSREVQLRDLIQETADAAKCGEELYARTLATLQEYARRIVGKREQMAVQVLCEMERLEQALRAEADTLRKRAALVATTREQLEQYVLSITTVDAAFDLSDISRALKSEERLEEVGR